MIAGQWYCQDGEGSGIKQCHAPEAIPLEPVQVNDSMPSWVLGKTIYKTEQLQQFYEFQQSQGVRAAYVSDQTELAYQGRSADGQWGLALGEQARRTLENWIGGAMVPFYSVIGPLATTMMFCVFCLGVVDVVFTVVFRMFHIVRRRGCGLWILAAGSATLFQVVIAPLLAVDKVAKDVADRVEKNLEVSEDVERNCTSRVKVNMEEVFKARRGEQLAIEMVPLRSPPAQIGRAHV